MGKRFFAEEGNSHSPLVFLVEKFDFRGHLQSGGTLGTFNGVESLSGVPEFY